MLQRVTELGRLLLTWVAGFVLTGELRHGATGRSLRQLDPRTILYRLFCIVIVGAPVVWFASLAPDILQYWIGFLLVGSIIARLAFWAGYLVFTRSVVAYTYWKSARGDPSGSFTSISEISRRLS